MDEQPTDHITVEDEGSVRVIRIDRGSVNALPFSTWEQLAATIGAASADASIRAVAIHGGDGRFCAGADIAELATPTPDADDAAMLTVVGQVASAIKACRIPVIAAVDGPAHGGGLELAIACDIRVASEGASFAASGVNVGLIASIDSLATAVGDTVARRMLLTGERVDAATALRWGLITDIVEAPLDAALAIAQGIAKKPPLAVEAAKAALNALPTQSPEERHTATTEAFRSLIATADHHEALDAFLQKRSATYDRT